MLTKKGYLGLRLVLWAILLTSGTTAAQDITRPVTTPWWVGAGAAEVADTYLSPLKYHGWSASIGYNRLQVLPWHNADSWISRLNIYADLDRTVNPAGNATMWDAGLHASWGTMRKWRIPYNITLAIGPALSVEAGCLYSARNSNNPASAKGAVTVNAIGLACWSHKIWKLPFTVSYTPSLSVLGAFFSPCYDELYYEIYLGNHSGLAHCAWWGNRFRLENTLSLDLHLGANSLRLGYENNILSSHVNNLTTRITTHRFIIGVTCDWVAINRKLSGHKIHTYRN